MICPSDSVLWFCTGKPNLFHYVRAYVYVRQWLQLQSDIHLTAIRPRYDQSMTYVTTCGLLH